MSVTNAYSLKSTGGGKSSAVIKSDKSGISMSSILLEISLKFSLTLMNASLIGSPSPDKLADPTFIIFMVMIFPYFEIMILSTFPADQLLTYARIHMKLPVKLKPKTPLVAVS